ncbi:serine/threonine protein kinase [Comamonas sp. JC664]|uniref:serine/threonine-protein kinase n=1 Tax=Comamonas sp. JC664 TaxID=2801917 RepID=UPI00174B4335|nr:serine/threonine protein kinase [Comamonas sp. JC664]MBL0696344.1 protein kinase [Comamonas sp. JC664]
MTRPADGDLRIDEVLRNTYRIVSLLGRGGMGSVYLAQHLRLPGKQVAVKVLRGGDHLTPEIFARFRREAEIASRLGHPNIVEVLDYDTLENGNPFLVLEFLRGESLQSRLERGRLPMEDVVSFTRQMGSALQAAHGAGIVHRDLKPANVYLVPTDSGGVVGERVKLLDFGISKVLSSQTVQTQEATIIGTPQYMSPEQAQGKNREIDARTDVFALGCIVYEMMAGKPVFGSGSLAQMIFRVVYEPPEPLAPLCPEASPEAISAVMRALEKSANDRYPDVASFVSDLTGTPLHSLSSTFGGQPAPRPQAPASGIALPSEGPASLSSTLPPGSLKVTPDTGREGFDSTLPPGTGRLDLPQATPQPHGFNPAATGQMGAVQPQPFSHSSTGQMGVAQAQGFNPAATGQMGAVQPSSAMDPPGLEPTLISKQVPALPAPERPAQPSTAVSVPVPIPGSEAVAAAALLSSSTPASAPKGKGAVIGVTAAVLLASSVGLIWWMKGASAIEVTPPPPVMDTRPTPDAPPVANTQPQPSDPQAIAPPPSNPQTGAQGVQQPPSDAPTGTDATDTAPVGVVANTTPDKPVTPRTPRTEPKEELPEQVRKLLKEGESALASGDAARAISLARSSQRAQRSTAAYSLLTRAYCQQKDLGGAVSEWPKVASAERAKVRKFCQKHDIEL